MPTMIYFRGRTDGVSVQGDARRVAEELRQGDAVRLLTTHGSVIYANWANVLYVEGVDEPAAVATIPSVS